MAGVKITKFLGKAPKISPELLPNTAAQVAWNCKLYSGDLIPYPQPVVVANTGRTGDIRTLYALRDPSTGEPEWLTWNADVEIAVASANLQDEQRFYYTGDGAPKVSNYELATTGAGPYPVGYYDLGLPVPPDHLTPATTAATFTTKNTASFARDAGNVATIVTSAAHGLRTGNIITLAGFAYRTGTYSQSGTTVTVTINGHNLLDGANILLDFDGGAISDGHYTIANVTTNTFEVTVETAATATGSIRWDIRNFNAANVECTVVDPTTFTYFCPGPQVAATSYTDGRVSLGGLTQARSYVYTWVTPWGEESIASKPSDNLYIKEGIIVTVSNLPTGPGGTPPGSNRSRGIRLYRTLPSASGTEYFRLATMWFPTTVMRVERSANVSRVTTMQPHNLDFDERIKIDGCTDSSFDIVDGVVLDLIDEYTFEYSQAGPSVPSTPVASGLVYYDVSENPPTTPSRYWADGGNYDFVDDFDARTLTLALDTDEYDPPPDDLRGLVAIQNNILAGFVGNALYFSEPGMPHAWPIQYETPIGEDIVALAAVSGSLLVLTKGYPHLVTVNDPASGIAVSRIDALYPCLSAKSVVTMEYGVVWSTTDGLAVYSPSSGPTLVTKVLYNRDTWMGDIDPTTVVGGYHSETYFASHAGGSFAFEHDPKVGGFFVDTAPTFSATWYDARTGVLYYAAGAAGDVYAWGDLAQPAMTMEWKSKAIITKDMVNLGAARVVADYGPSTTLWEAATYPWESALGFWDVSGTVEFRLWADKQLVFTTTLGSDDGFRLPTGYRTDTFEVGVEGAVRVRAVHLSETMLGLREV